MPPTLPEHLLHQLVVGDPAAITTIVEASRTCRAGSNGCPTCTSKAPEQGTDRRAT
jgi:hypothetical protein